MGLFFPPSDVNTHSVKNASKNKMVYIFFSSLANMYNNFNPFYGYQVRIKMQ